MIKDALKEIRESTKMNKKEFADSIGVKYTTYNGYETGTREPDSDFLILISKKFDVSIDYILGLQDRKEMLHAYQLRSDEFEHIKKYRDLDDHGRESVNIILDRETQRVKSLANMQKQLSTQSTYVIELEKATRPHYTISYYQKLASAGSGEYLFDNVPTDTIDVPVTALSEQADFAIGVNGNSMEPTYYDGDKVYVRLTEEIPTGHIGVFTRGNECFIKELGNDRLISHNHAGGYKDIPASEEIKLVGEVLGKVEEI